MTVRPLRDILPPFRLSIATTSRLVPQASDLADLLVAAISGWPNASPAESDAAPAARPRRSGAARGDPSGSTTRPPSAQPQASACATPQA